MIHSIIGLMSSGKTLYMSYLGYQDFLKGYTIISNYDLNFSHYLCNRDFLIYLAKEQPKLNNITFLLDEFWLWCENRASMSYANRLITFFLNQSSKGLTNIYVTAQRNSQNELRLRENQHLLTICKRKVLIDEKYYNISDEQRILPLDMQDKLYIDIETYLQKMQSIYAEYKLKQHLRLKAKPFFKLYDTSQKMKSGLIESIA